MSNSKCSHVVVVAKAAGLRFVRTIVGADAEIKRLEASPGPGSLWCIATDGAHVATLRLQLVHLAPGGDA